MKRGIASLIFKTIAIVSSFLLVSYNSFSQEEDSLKNTLSINGMISVTNNGFSFIPAFTLDKPAALAFISIEKKRLSFNTEARYALDGRPWALAFIPRYKLIDTKKQQISIGVQFPSISFARIPVVKDGVQQETIQAQQSITPEINANLSISNHVGIGTSYLYNRGLGNTLPKNGHFLGLWGNVANIKVLKTLQLSFNSQVFYLYLDHTHGYYTAWSFVLSKDKCPITLSSMMYKTINSNIGGKDANWNLSINYVFGRKYVKK